MKKLFAFLAFCTISLLSYSQIQITEEDGAGEDISGTTLTLSGGELLYKTFDIKNTSGTVSSLKVERIKLMETEGTSDFVCWGSSPENGICYPASNVSPNDLWASGLFDIETDTPGWLSIYYNANENVGNTHFRYYITNESDTRLDSIDIVYASTVGIESKENYDINIYPNPANDIINISLKIGIADVDLTIYNIIGEAIVEQRLIAGLNTLKTNSLVNGVYFYAIRNKNETLQTKKLIIKH